MSRIGDINLQIEEQLADLGFVDIEEAKQAGYVLHIVNNIVKLKRRTK